MDNLIPNEVIEIITQHQESQRIEKEKKNLEEQRVAEEIDGKGKAIVDQWIEDAFQSIPAWLHQYYVPNGKSLDYYRVVQGWDREEDIVLTFNIPGLAQIQFKNNAWRSEDCGWNRGYESDEPYMQFTSNSYWRSSLEATLVITKKEMEEHQNNLIEYEAEQARDFKRNADEAELEEQIRKIQAEKEENKAAAQQAEEEALLQSLKNDPVAIHMLKAFILLRDERSTFEQRIEEMVDEMYGMEDRWSRKAADLRRQAEDADRRAREEQSRLQSDLDDVEAKLKKTQQRW